MTIYGYCRVSTNRQNIDRQIRNIKEKYPDAAIIQDKFTGANFNRPGWTKLFSKAQAGDTIVFDEVSRMSRDAEEGFDIYQELYNRGVSLVFLKEPHINTEVYKAAAEKQINLQMNSGSKPIDLFTEKIVESINELMLDLAKEQIRLSFGKAESELKYLRQRTSEGMKTAKIKGKRVGTQPGEQFNIKKKPAAMKIIRKYSKDFDGDMTDKACMKQASLSRNTYYKYKKELLQEAQAEQIKLYNDTQHKHNDVV